MKYVIPSLIAVILSNTSVSSAQQLFQNVQSPPEVSVQLGRHSVLIRAGAFGLNHFPDEPIAILQESPLTFLMVCGDSTYVFSGKDFSNAKPLGKVLEPGSGTEIDNGYAGVGAAFVVDDKIQAFYHAEDHKGIGKVQVNNVQGFFGTICLAQAEVKEKQLHKQGAVITADKPKLPRGWETEGGPPAAWLAQGVGEPHVIYDKSEQHLLCYYTEWSNRLKRGVQICVARSLKSNLGIPGSWKKYYQGSFSEKGLGGHETPVISAGNMADTFTAHVNYIKQWDRYLMVFGAGVQTEINSRRPRAKKSGLYVATSADGIKWSTPVKAWEIFPLVINGNACAVHPTLRVNAVDGNTLKGTLLYGYTPNWGRVPHHLGGRSITVRLGVDAPEVTATPNSLSNKSRVDMNLEKNTPGKYRLDMKNLRTGKQSSQTMELRANKTVGLRDDSNDGRWKIESGVLSLDMPGFIIQNVKRLKNGSYSGSVTAPRRLLLPVAGPKDLPGKSIRARFTLSKLE